MFWDRLVVFFFGFNYMIAYFYTFVMNFNVKEQRKKEYKGAIPKKY